MEIQPNQNLLHYRLLEKIGEGGMGVVWKAIDPSLNREVAIKLLPDRMDQIPDSLVRFEREAKLLASISHPNIAVIHGLHKAEDTHFLAMEFVPGEDLEQLLSRGRLSLEDLLKIALPIADALEAAHEQGVVHRDLKPANVLVTPEGVVKILDFGLAKSMEPTPDPQDLRNSPTMTSAGTMVGVILGTAGYMSPEQAKGQNVDRRADIWAFGILLFEMLTGSRVYEEQTVSEAIAAVLLKEPDWSRIPANTPPSLEKLIRRCLTKDPRSRLRDMGEARVSLERLIQGEDDSIPTALPAGKSRILKWAAPILVVGALLGFGLNQLLSSSDTNTDAPESLALSIFPAEGAGEVYSPAVSPDGKTVVYQAIADGDVHLFRRDLASGLTEKIPGTEGTGSFFFSPDGQWIGFFAGGSLKKVAKIGGDALTILDGVISARPGSVWLEDGSIVYSDWLTGFSRVDSDGGVPEVLTIPDEAADEIAHWWPERIPGGRHLLFTLWPKGAGINDASIGVLDLESKTWKTLFPGARAAFSPPDRLLFYRAGNYMEARINTETMALLSEPRPVPYSIRMQHPHGSSRNSFALGPKNMLVYVADESIYPLRKLEWYDRQGNRTAVEDEPRAYDGLSLSPDGQRLVTTEFEGGSFRLVLKDLARGTREVLGNPGSNSRVFWTADGGHIGFVSLRIGNFDLFRSRPDGSEEISILTGTRDDELRGWFSDGKRFLTERSGQDLVSLEEIDLESGDSKSFFSGTALPRNARISADDRWLVYSLNTSGPQEVYVQRATPGSRRIRISSQGGDLPDFSPAGNELFYLRGNEFVAVDYRVEGENFIVGQERVLFEVEALRGGHFNRWAVGPKAERFLIINQAVPGSGVPELRVVYGW